MEKADGLKRDAKRARNDILDAEELIVYHQKVIERKTAFMCKQLDALNELNPIIEKGKKTAYHKYEKFKKKEAKDLIVYQKAAEQIQKAFPMLRVTRFLYQAPLKVLETEAVDQAPLKKVHKTVPSVPSVPLKGQKTVMKGKQLKQIAFISKRTQQQMEKADGLNRDAKRARNDILIAEDLIFYHQKVIERKTAFMCKQLDALNELNPIIEKGKKTAYHKYEKFKKKEAKDLTVYQKAAEQVQKAFPMLRLTRFLRQATLKVLETEAAVDQAPLKKVA